jgi:hypothetical protein
MGTIQEDGMLAHLPQRSGNFDGSWGGLVSTPPSSRKPQSSPTAAKHFQVPRTQCYVWDCIISCVGV